MSIPPDLTKPDVRKRLNGASRWFGSMAASEMRTEPATVTPELAAHWLEKLAPGQRSISANTVASIAWDIQNGRWELTHQGIAFNRAGELIDGQHRLAAVVKAKLSIPILVATGVPAEFASPIDVGRSRSVAIVLGKHRQHVAVCRSLAVIVSGVGGRFSAAQIEAIYQDHSEGVDFALPFALSATGPRRGAGIYAAYAYAYPIAPEKVKEFAEQVQSGERIAAGMPAFVFRGWLERTHGRRPHDSLVAYATLGCLRAHVRGNTHSHVYTAPMGKQWFDGQRRKFRLPAPPASGGDEE